MTIKLINPTAATKIETRISMCFKKCLGLNKKLSRKKLYGWIQEFTPSQRADFTILRTMVKLDHIGLKLHNATLIYKRLTTIPEDIKIEYLEGKITIKTLKDIVEKARDNETGINHGKAFLFLDQHTSEWFRWITDDFEHFRWKNKECSLCKEALETKHLTECPLLNHDRDKIEAITGIKAELLTTDPSLLNTLKKRHRTDMQKKIADIIKFMIQKITPKAELSQKM